MSYEDRWIKHNTKQNEADAIRLYIHVDTSL